MSVSKCFTGHNAIFPKSKLISLIYQGKNLERERREAGSFLQGMVRIAMGAIIDRNNNIVAFQANILSTISFLKIWFER